MSSIVDRLEADGSELSLEAAKALRAQYRRATDAEYLKSAYRQMLGPTGKMVAENWEKRGVSRVHFSWGDNAHTLSGEERAQVILDVDSIDG